MLEPGGIFHPALRVYQIWGTRRGVGKTVSSSMLTWAAAKVRRAKGARDHVGYVKPLDIGHLGQADHLVVRLMHNKMMRGKNMPHFLNVKSIFHFAATAPYPGLVRDEELLDAVRSYSASCAADLDPPGGWLFVETLDGVESLLPSGKCQADVYKPLRLPAILVGDGNRGVDDTVSAFEALRRRDYDVQSVMVLRDPDENHLRIAEHFDKLDIRCLCLRPLPEKHFVQSKDSNQLAQWHSGTARSNAVKELLRDLYDRHDERARELGTEGASPELSGATTGEIKVCDRKLQFAYHVPGKHKHKV